MSVVVKRSPISATAVVGSYLDALVSAADEQSVSLVDGDWDHDNERTQPDRAEHSVRMGDGLPAARPQRPTDGKVALQRYGHQSQRADAHRHSCVHHIRRTPPVTMIASRNFSTPRVSAATPRWIFTIITERIEYKLISLT